jgi:hypothetical protein
MKTYEHKYQLKVFDELPTLLKNEDGNVRDLAASCLSSLSMYKIMKELPDHTLKIILKDKLKHLQKFMLTTEKRGIFDEHPYAKFRSTLATIDYNWLDEGSWTRTAKPTLEKFKKEKDLEKIADEYLERGAKLYELNR